MHFECDISPSRIKTLTQSHPCQIVSHHLQGKVDKKILFHSNMKFVLEWVAYQDSFIILFIASLLYKNSLRKYCMQVLELLSFLNELKKQNKEKLLNKLMSYWCSLTIALFPDSCNLLLKTLNSVVNCDTLNKGNWNTHTRVTEKKEALITV